VSLTQKILLFTSLLVVALVATSLGFTTVQADRLAHENVLRGLDEIGRTLLEGDRIAAYERSRA